MQVANDVASTKELPSCEARPGRRVPPGSCRAARRGRSGVWSRWPREAWSAEMPVSRLASCAATKASVQHCVCYLSVHLQWSVQPVHRGEQGGQRAGVRLAGEGGVQGCRGDCV